MPSTRLTPEQVEAERTVFEKKIGEWWQYGFEQYPEGAGYTDKDLNNMWEGWLQAIHMNWDTLQYRGVPEAQPSTSSPADQLRRMRGYSKCFTGAFDKLEPVFVLRAQDKTAYLALAQWINVNIERMGKANPKIISAKATLRLFMVHEGSKDAD